VGATPRFSPDGKRLLFMRETRFHEKEKAGVFVIGFDGEGERRLCEGRWPDWSPDGKQIAFSKGGEFEKGGTVVGARVYVASADGKNPRELCAGDGPAWSPDGNRKPHQVVETSHATREHSCHCPIWAFRRHLVLWPSPRRSCGMVPPIYVTDNTSIVRVGDEQTYVFYKDGLETFVIRPGFSGKVEDFGMLISFPTPPALRKVSEDIFPQIAKAIDPPEVVVDLRPRPGVTVFFSRSEVRQSKRDFDGLALGKDEVRVLKQEAVGMYEVAVLEAGSAKALKRWMDDHGYKYPSGMDAACEEYVKLAGALWPRRPRSAARPTSIPSRG
jgi:hypothetical protein